MQSSVTAMAQSAARAGGPLLAGMAGWPLFFGIVGVLLSLSAWAMYRLHGVLGRWVDQRNHRETDATAGATVLVAPH